MGSKSSFSSDDKLQILLQLKELQLKIQNIESFLENQRKAKEIESMLRSMSALANGGTIIYIVVKALGWF